MLNFSPISGAVQLRREVGSGAALAQSPTVDEAQRMEIRAAVVEFANQTLQKARGLMTTVERSAAEMRTQEFRPGDALDPDVLRGQVVDAAAKIISLVDESLVPPLEPYLTQESEQTFMEAVDQAIAAADRAAALGIAPLRDGMAPAANEYAISVLDELKEMRDDAHRMIVAFEGIEGPQEMSSPHGALPMQRS